jgi:hypothetical protein
MHNNTERQVTGIDFRETGTAITASIPPSMLDVGCSMLDVPAPVTFDELQASQAREDFIQFTKIFFGLDNQCPCPAGNLSA